MYCFQNFAGICGALMIGVGALGAVVAGIYVDKTKRFEEVVKVCWCLSVLFGIGFTQVGALYHVDIVARQPIIVFFFYQVIPKPACSATETS